MKSPVRTTLTFTLIILFLCSFAQIAFGQEKEDNSNKLAVVWTSGDPDVAHRVAFMYTYKAKKFS